MGGVSYLMFPSLIGRLKTLVLYLYTI